MHQAYIVSIQKHHRLRINDNAHLLLLDRLKNLDNALFIVGDIYTFKYLTILSSSNFPDNLIIILTTVLKEFY